MTSPAEGSRPRNGEGADRDGRVERRLGDLTEFVGEAAYLTSKGREAYLAESMDGALLRNAGERILIKVATVAERLPQAFKDSHPDVDWQGSTACGTWSPTITTGSVTTSCGPPLPPESLNSAQGCPELSHCIGAPNTLYAARSALAPSCL